MSSTVKSSYRTTVTVHLRDHNTPRMECFLLLLHAWVSTSDNWTHWISDHVLFSLDAALLTRGVDCSVFNPTVSYRLVMRWGTWNSHPYYLMCVWSMLEMPHYATLCHPLNSFSAVLWFTHTYQAKVENKLFKSVPGDDSTWHWESKRKNTQIRLS